MSGSIDKLWADFYEWPERWKGFPEDVAYGEGIIEIYKPLDTEEEMRSYDATCKKLFKFLRERTPNKS